MKDKLFIVDIQPQYKILLLHSARRDTSQLVKVAFKMKLLAAV